MIANLYSRLGNLEGDIEGMQREINDTKQDINQIQNMLSESAKQLSTLTNFMSNQLTKKKEMTRWEMVLVSAGLSILASVIVGILAVMMR